MATLNGTVPHCVTVQLGDVPDPNRDGHACVHIPLDETAEGVGTQLAEIARLMISTSKILRPSKGFGVVIDVDGTACRIEVSDVSQTAELMDDQDLAKKLSDLVAPQGWKPA